MSRFTADIVHASVVAADGIDTTASASGVRAESGVAKVVAQILASGSAGLGSAIIDLATSAKVASGTLRKLAQMASFLFR